MSERNDQIVTGVVLGERETITLKTLAGLCAVETRWVVELVEQGALEPLDPAQSQWEFSAVVLKRVRTAAHLRHDLELNPAGIALALDLLDQIETLRAQLNTLQSLP
ncbi:MAG: chaperone modulator CbpM [Gammaproteobacteria bacterium]